MMTLVQEKKGGPYPKDEKIKRQNEVFRLHFDYGYSAVKISEMMNVNRNTINGDINYWYSILSKEWNSCDLDTWGMKQVHRLESQRTRLFRELEKEEKVIIKLSIEKMILDIDTRVMNFVSKTISIKDAVQKGATDRANQWAKRKNIDLKFIDANDMWCASNKTYKKFQKMLKEDLENKHRKRRFD